MARIGLRHRPRARAADVVARLAHEGLGVLVLSGDNEDAVAATCHGVGA